MDTSLTLQAGLQSALSAQVGAASASGRVVEQSSRAPRSANQEAPPVQPTLAGVGYGQLRVRQEYMNDLALQVRREGPPLEIRKLFPPYPPEQEARMVYLDQISGMRRHIETLMSLMGSGDGPGLSPDEFANELAYELSHDSRNLLADLPQQQAISTNRPLLEVVAQNDLD